MKREITSQGVRFPRRAHKRSTGGGLGPQTRAASGWMAAGQIHLSSMGHHIAFINRHKAYTSLYLEKNIL